QAALQKQVRTGEQVVSNTMRCTPAVSANHAAGDHAPNVTVRVSVTCKEEDYDQQAAQTMAANLLAKQVGTDLGPNYALKGNTMPDAAHNKFVIVAVPGVAGSPTTGKGAATNTPRGPTAVPSGTVTAPVKPTPTATQGLGGS